MFTEDDRRALEILLALQTVPDEFYFYWSDAVNTVGYTPKLLLMFSAIEALAKAGAGRKNWEVIQAILGKQLTEDLFGTKQNSRVGLRYRLIHGEYLNPTDSDKNYLESDPRKGHKLL